MGRVQPGTGSTGPGLGGTTVRPRGISKALSRVREDATFVEDKTGELQAAVVAFNESHDASACAGFSGLLMEALAYLVRYGNCEEIGGEVVGYEFDQDTCRIEGCDCAIHVPPPLPPLEPPGPFPFGPWDEDWDLDNWSW